MSLKELLGYGTFVRVRVAFWFYTFLGQKAILMYKFIIRRKSCRLCLEDHQRMAVQVTDLPGSTDLPFSIACLVDAIKHVADLYEAAPRRFAIYQNIGQPRSRRRHEADM